MKKVNYINEGLFKGWNKEYLKICPTCGEKIYHYHNPKSGESFDTECICIERERTAKEVSEMMNNKTSIIAFNKQHCGFSKRDLEDIKVPIKTHKGNIKTYDTIIKYSNNFNDNVSKGLYIYGDPGVGKSLFSKKIMSIILNKGYSAYITSVTKLMKDIKKELSIFNDDTYRKCLKVDLLVIDDLGVEKTTDFDKEQIFAIINTRYEDKKPIIYTSNCKLEDLITKYDEFGRIYSRISGSVIKLEIRGIDFRQSV